MSERRDVDRDSGRCGEERERGCALVHLAGGVGNIVLATPLLVELDRRNWEIDVWLSADYEGVASLFDDWSVVHRVFERPLRADELGEYDLLVPAVPPFYWHRYATYYTGQPHCVPRPPDASFYENEQDFYLEFARGRDGTRPSPSLYRLPITLVDDHLVSLRTLVLAPGCKTGEMAAKRWPFYPELAERFEDVAVVGTADDLQAPGSEPIRFPDHVRILAGQLTLRQTAEVLASCGAVVGNDSGLAHVAAAVGTPTVMIFGPTPHRTLGRLPPNVTVLRAGLPCEPCWFGDRLAACAGRIDCLRSLSVDEVEAQLTLILGT